MILFIFLSAESGLLWEIYVEEEWVNQTSSQTLCAKNYWFFSFKCITQMLKCFINTMHWSEFVHFLGKLLFPCYFNQSATNIQHDILHFAWSITRLKLGFCVTAVFLQQGTVVFCTILYVCYCECVKNGRYFVRRIQHLPIKSNIQTDIYWSMFIKKHP